MDDGWVGRKLMLASRHLGERFQEHAYAAGPMGPAIAAIVPGLLREIGRSIALAEEGHYLPFARTRGVLRLPPEESSPAVAQAYGAVARLVSDYLTHLPGATDEQKKFSRAALTHAARATLRIHRQLLTGSNEFERERLFGGVSVLAFPAHVMARRAAEGT